MALFGVDREEFDQFSRDVLSRINSLDGALKVRLSALEEEVKLKATDSENQARAAAESAQEIERDIKGVGAAVKSIFGDLELCKSVAEKELDDVKEIKKVLEVDAENLAVAVTTVRRSYDEFAEQKSAVDAAVVETYEVLGELNKVLAGREELEARVEAVSVLLEKSTEAHKNISGLLNHSLKKKSEIDELYNSIFGYEIKGDDGSVQGVDGLRDELESAYDDLRSGLETIDSIIKDVVKGIEEKYSLELDQQKKLFETLVSDSNDRITAVDDELKGLLPGGMAAGLSAAYEAKKEEEEESQKKHGENFQYAIVAMVLISLIPFAVDTYLLTVKGLDIFQVIKETPTIIISILPLYFPVLWFALSTSKKLNLSKRLIEEYTHKAVLGKTFSGLSNQIASLSHEGAVKDELRTRLLFNMLQVSSENPGKLITDYNKSDHPFMEALENSSKLGGAIEALSKLPGFTALADKLSKKAQDFVDSQSQKIETGLAVHEAFESKSESEKPAETRV